MFFWLKINIGVEELKVSDFPKSNIYLWFVKARFP